MKKLFIIAALLSPFTFHFSSVKAQAVVSDGFDRLQVTYKTDSPEPQIDGYNYTHLTLQGYTSGGAVGAPALPVRGDIIEVPFCDNIVVTVENAVYDTLQLAKYNIVYPQQPSRSKSDTGWHKIVFDEKVYEADAFYGLPLAEVEVMGVARDRRLAQLRYSPVQVNPVTGQIVVCRSADVTVTYVGADADRTLKHYQRYHTPAFSAGKTLNNLYSNSPAAKQISIAPVRMVIAVPNVLRCKAIERFARWKRNQGFMVDVLYYQDQGITTNTALASHFASLYSNATANAPAPTYILLVGDHNQLAAFNSRINPSGYYDVDNDHITDLYFATWTSGDYLPDGYQGRFSATDTNTLTNIINKTLYYEQYSFTDDSYLARATLVAGEDNGYHTSSGWTADNAWIYADPTMDYIAYNYVNAANGFTNVTYYKNDTSYAPSGVTVSGYCSASNAAVTLRNLYNTGIGWINYSAHGDWDEWSIPAFKVSHVNSMSNNGKPSFMIGNCCLSNKFDKATCFGEALLRKANNAGAVAYIGGTNYTYWTEDFCWAVGVRSSINHTTPPNYNANKLGSYDHLFHTHSEAFENYATSAGAMVYYGGLSVNSSTSSSYANMKKYYWEIYELMGDPSLMPWAGKAQEMSLSFTRNGDQVRVTTLPYTYVAFFDTVSTIYAAGFAGADGKINFSISSDVDLSSAFVSATLQNHKPFLATYSELVVAIQEPQSLSAIALYPNPATDRVTIDGLPDGCTAEFYDAQGRLQLTQSLSHSASQTLDVSALTPGLYLLRITTPEGVAVRKLIKK